MAQNFKELANTIWGVADLLRGDYKQAEYGKVILPFTILRRLDCVLEPTKDKVLKKYEALKTTSVKNIDPALNKTAGYNFHNRSKFDFDKLIGDPNHLASNLRNYVNGFSDDARDIFEKFKFAEQIKRLDDANLLFLVTKKFQAEDLHPNVVDNMTMGYVFEELIRKFAESSNETAGEHYTPREVIKLMVNLLFLNDKEILTKEGVVKTIYDSCAGTCGMLSVADEYLHKLNPDAKLELFGQELNGESYAIAKAEMLIKGQNPANIANANTLSTDNFPTEKFDYLITNPPFGTSWDKVAKEVKKEYEDKGYGGRFGAGLPRVNDGSLLFLQHLISKMKQDASGSRIAIVFNGSPLFTGGAGSGESEIRKWIIENDMLEAVIGLPDQLFYNTGISTYIWVLTNRKDKKRKGKVQLIDATTFFNRMTKSLGNKRNEISPEHINEITKTYGNFKENEYCKLFNNQDFGYSRITVERPSLDEKGKPMKDKKGELKANAELRDNENVPLTENIQEYFKREVIPHAPDAWIDESKTKVGYEINFTKYFYKYQPLRTLSEIKNDILKLEQETEGLLNQVIEA